MITRNSIAVGLICFEMVIMTNRTVQKDRGYRYRGDAITKLNDLHQFELYALRQLLCNIFIPSNSDC
jgi:hypothetical protein